MGRQIPLRDAATIAADALRGGGRVAYAAAGSSGLMALADALELPGTFGIPRDRIIVMLAGGIEALANLAGAPEDDAAQAMRDVADAGLSEGDCLIALSASGSTPYAVAALEQAKRLGCPTIAIANNPGTPIINLADAGDRARDAAGTDRRIDPHGRGNGAEDRAQHAFDIDGDKLGHVHDGYMVNLHADNLKLKDRAARIVAAVCRLRPQ